MTSRYPSGFWFLCPDVFGLYSKLRIARMSVMVQELVDETLVWLWVKVRLEGAVSALPSAGWRVHHSGCPGSSLWEKEPSLPVRTI